LGSSYSEGIISKLQNLFDENILIDSYFHLMSLRKELLIRKYSRRTIKSYMKYNRDFLLFSGKEPKNVDDEDIKTISALSADIISRWHHISTKYGYN